MLADWDIPLHTSYVEAVLLFRGKNTPRLGGCEFLFDEELIFETKDLTITHYVDEVQGPGRWAYAAYSRDFKKEWAIHPDNHSASAKSGPDDKECSLATL